VEEPGVLVSFLDSAEFTALFPMRILSLDRAVELRAGLVAATNFLRRQQPRLLIEVD
jgi:hypothetical protein